MIIKLPPLTDKEIYSLQPSDRLYRSCDNCKCVICSEIYFCKNCYLCEFRAFPVLRRCIDLNFQIFSREPYKSYLSEVDKINGYKPPKRYR